MDLVAGLHWLRESLPAFGGDPSRVTVLGHGTGASLAHLLALSPLADEFQMYSTRNNLLRVSMLKQIDL
ncbi:hypothetical protein J437_LFUL002310 [Ladona fulva]|uniref:Carboxylesterase type B domain-containing protein n=1 Tax=Ladona fulva TaxID=123851 RepID=A0A8K0K1E3_LADFU|nr:hypothetical protein J437_LFUL002310 [Ladona fulva]